VEAAAGGCGYENEKKSGLGEALWLKHNPTREITLIH